MILFLGLLLSSCAIAGEIYRLQTRFSYWNNILSPEERQLFAQNDTNQLGMIIDKKESEDTNFAKKMRELRINEAIMSFDGTQTAHFFYHVLLKDLVKFSYKEFIDTLDSNEQLLFAQTQFFTNIPFDNKNLKKVFDNAKNNYGLNDFTDIQILNYYRHISLPATTYVEVYNILAFLARYTALDSFLSGDYSHPLAIFSLINNAVNSKREMLKKQGKKELKVWRDIKERTLLTKLSNKDFLIVIHSTILPEMDADVRIKTIDNIKNRFGDKS